MASPVLETYRETLSRTGRIDPGRFERDLRGVLGESFGHQELRDVAIGLL